MWSWRRVLSTNLKGQGALSMYVGRLGYVYIPVFVCGWVSVCMRMRACLCVCARMCASN